MADVPTIIETGNNGFGGMNPFNGAGLGAGFIGGLVLGSIWNGGFGWGGNRGAGQAAADASLMNGIQNLSNQAQQNAISQLQSSNTLGMQVANTAASVTAGINANTVAQLQGQNAMQQQMCCCCNNLGQQIDAAGDQTTAAINSAALQAMQTAQGTNDRLCAINNNITNQGYETRITAQSLAAQLAQQHADLKAQISDENCKDRELMRDIQAQAVRDQLAQCQSQNAALNAQINLTQQLQNQTLYLISQLQPTAAARVTNATSAGA